LTLPRPYATVGGPEPGVGMTYSLEKAEAEMRELG
jgi:hypothetical protein